MEAGKEDPVKTIKEIRGLLDKLVSGGHGRPQEEVARTQLDDSKCWKG